MFLRLFILLLVQTMGQENSSQATVFRSLSYRETVIKGEGTKGPYKLPDIFIIGSSEIVRKDSTILERDKDYFLNARDGTLLFFEPLKEGETVTVCYYYFPFDIKKEYKRRDISSFVQGNPVIKRENKEEKVSRNDGKDGIVLGGAKTFSVGMNSSGDFSFDQSLRVNVTGEVTKGISISGVLSDENAPLEPEGSTESLEELDRIFLTVKGKGLGATIGDYELSYTTPTSVVVQRDLLGVSGDIEKNGIQLNTSFGLARGKYHSLHLKGNEGKQGPYQLKGANGEEDIVIVAGSETIYLDGLLLTRGEKNDYVIEYSLAQITFTFKRMITDESDIVAEYQYTRFGFQKNLYCAKINYERKKINIGGFFVREGDEISQTEGFELTKERKTFLSQLGDDTTGSWMESGVYVGVGKGDYSFSDSFYVYEGYRKGEWNVSFTYVATNKGDYVYSDSLAGFLYVGNSNGDYVSEIRVSLPERENYAGVFIGVGGDKMLNLEGEILTSDYDRNILSGIDDTDNMGLLGRFRAEITVPRRKWGTMNFAANYQRRDNHFKPLSRIENEDFERRWNLTKTTGMEDIKNGRFVYEMENLFKSKASLSVLKRENITAQLEEGSFSFMRGNIPHFNVTASNLKIDGDTLLRSVKKKGIDASYSIWRFLPGVSATEELRNEAVRKRWRELGGKLGFLISKGTNISAGSSKRYDAILDTAKVVYENESQTITKTLGFGTEVGRMFTGNLDVTARKRTYEREYPGENSEILLVESATHFMPFGKQFEIETNYSITGRNSVLFKEMFYEVEDGKGDYSRDSISGDYYSDTLGNYQRKVESVGEGNPVTDVKTYLRIGFSPVKILRCNLTANVREENRAEEKLPLYTLRLSKFLDDSLTVTGNQSLDGDIFLYPVKKTTVSCAFSFMKGLSNELVTQARRNYADRVEFSLEQTLTADNRFSLKYLRNRKTEEGVGLGLEKNEKKQEITPEYSHYLLPNLEVTFSITKGNVKIEEPLWYGNLGIVGIDKEAASTAFAYTLMNSAIVNMSFSLTKNSTEVDKDVLPSDVKTFYPIGITTEWKMGSNIGLSNMFTLNFSYNGINRPDKKTLHSANAEVRADF